MSESERRDIPPVEAPELTRSENDLLDEMLAKLKELSDFLQSQLVDGGDLVSYNKKFSTDFGLTLADYVLCLQGTPDEKKQRSDIAHRLKEPLFHVLGKLESAALTTGDRQQRAHYISETLSFIPSAEYAIRTRQKELIKNP